MSDRIIPFDANRRRRATNVVEVPAPRQPPPVPRVPDFARADATWLQARDIAFLLDIDDHAPHDNGLITEGISPALEALLEREGVYYARVPARPAAGSISRRRCISTSCCGGCCPCHRTICSGA